MSLSQITNNVKPLATVIPDPLPVDIIAPNPVPVVVSPNPLPISASSLPLPTGAATSTNQATEIAALASILADLNNILAAQATAANQVLQSGYLQALLLGKSTATLKSITVTNPAAGSGWTVSPPPGRIWKIISGSWAFVAQVVAANRVPNIFSSTGGVVFFNDLARTAVTSGQTVRINAFGSGQLATDILTPSENIFLSLPPDLLIDSGDVLTGSTNNNQSGDQFSGIMLKVIEYA